MEKSTHLKNEKIKLNKNRKDILWALDKHESPLTAEQIYENLKNEDNKISLSTVYRNLTFFCDRKIIKKTMLDSATAVYEIDKQKCTHHLICEGCAKIQIIEKCPINKEWEDLAESYGFNITRHNIEIFGKCADCRDE